MKQTYNILILIWAIMICGYTQVNAQISEQSQLEENSSDTVLIVIQATDDYKVLPQALKTETINGFLKSINTELVSVRYGNKRELWHKDNVTGTFVLLDTLDMNTVRINKPSGKKLVSNHTFISFGGQLSYQNDFNAYLNVTAGRFLWKDKWDMALSIGCGFSASATVLSIGHLSKYYYPMTFHGQRISPYVGAGISYYFSKNKDADGKGSSSYNVYGTVGSSWRIGPGALDAGFRFGNVNKFAFVVGYTFLF
ncbi:MAG: hypothetical protein LBH30_03260 [Prevotellaceae bacterium]|jgi:hypothetical protein|nr:hypothetical protein [Prevotellaceae bacterium]